MACLTPLDLAEAVRLGAEYALDVVGVTALQAGSVNSNFRLEQRGGALAFARIYEEQDASGAGAEVQLLTELAEIGVATPAPLLRLDRAPVGFASGKPFAAYPWVEGHWLCHQRLTPVHCEILGRALAQVHLATPRLSHVPDGRFGPSQIRQRLGVVEASAPRYAREVQQIEQRLEDYERGRVLGLPSGLVHGDLFRDNVLWKETPDSARPELAALLDFESASFGVFVYDLMVCMLSWCFTSELQSERAAAMLSGYESRRVLTENERSAAVSEGQYACLRFATTRLTDFELRTPAGQIPERDFRRFLLRYEMLAQGGLNAVLRSQ